MAVKAAAALALAAVATVTSTLWPGEVDPVEAGECTHLHEALGDALGGHGPRAVTDEVRKVINTTLDAIERTCGPESFSAATATVDAWARSAGPDG